MYGEAFALSTSLFSFSFVSNLGLQRVKNLDNHAQRDTGEEHLLLYSNPILKKQRHLWIGSLFFSKKEKKNVDVCNDFVFFPKRFPSFKFFFFVLFDKERVLCPVFLHSFSIFPSFRWGEGKKLCSLPKTQIKKYKFV